MHLSFSQVCIKQPGTGQPQDPPPKKKKKTLASGHGQSISSLGAGEKKTMALSWTWAKQLDPGSVPLSSFLACCVSLRFRFPLAGNLMKEVSPCHGRVLFDRVVVSFHLFRCMSLAYFRYLVHGHPFDNGSISPSEQRARALQISAMPCRHGLFLKSSPMIAERRTELTAHHCPCACFITMSPTEHDSRCQYLLPAYITCEP